MKPVRPDRLRDVVDAVVQALDEGLDGAALAARAMLSPFHFNRLVRAGISEAPAGFRRPLRELGVRDVESRDPIEWERAIAARQAGTMAAR
jgi:transcriptional regulator GlxA family with amidase domain